MVHLAAAMQFRTRLPCCMLIHLLRLATRETGAKALAVASAAIRTANLNILVNLSIADVLRGS